MELTGGAQQAARSVNDQLRAAILGETLPRLDAEPLDPEMFNAPANNAGAYGRAAYWLAIASRLAQARGVPSSAMTWGAQAAGSRLVASQTLFAAWYYDPSATNDVQQILTDAANTAAPIPEVANQLRQLQNVGAIKLSQQEAVGTGWFAQAKAELAPEWTKTWWFTPAAVTVGVVILLGVAAWALRPYAQAVSTLRRNRRNRRWRRA
jgi:hypothetical protein